MSMKMDSPGAELATDQLSILPSDASEQLELAHRITLHAFQQKMAVLEAEASALRQQLTQKNTQIKAMERRLGNMEFELSEANEKVKISLEEQAKISGERNNLQSQVKKLSRDVSKLENLKRNLLHSLTDEDDPSALDQSAAADFGSYSSPFARSNSRSSPRPASTSHDRLRNQSSARPSSAGHTTNGSTSAPPNFFSKKPTTETQSNNSSPVRIDGKEFFRQARGRLTYEQFSKFLQNIKELNAHRQTREETLNRAREIFGKDGRDLYLSFENLLSRHLPL